MSEDGEVREIVIVRRRHDGDHDDAHGGVWKVAFADFMTAMMAFFLVLWIVNSTSKETRASVARYFNPVRLSDTTPARKGLQEPREEDFDASVKAAADAPKKTAEQDEKAAHDKKEPEAAAAPAKQPGAEKSVHAAAPSAAIAARDAAAGGGVASDGPPGVLIVEQYRDPFEPMAPTRVESRQSKDAALSVTPSKAEAAGAAPARKIEGQASADATTMANAAVNAAALGKRIEALAKQAGTAGAPAVDVRETTEGTLISLTDRADYGMFAVGSAEPNDALVRLVTSLGGLLKSGGASIVVRGYTDSRRYRKPGYDNWRLSTGRAQAACDMLLRGGVEERRIERVEGYADHKLKNPNTPDAAENRRIEILLRKDGA